LCLAGLPAQGAHTQARLIFAAEAARPGDTVLAGVRLQMDPRWHTYWKNAGAAGTPTKIEWQLPSGVTAGPTQWPLPEKLPDDDLTTYIYSNEVVLLTPLKLAADLPAGALEIRAKVSWLECDQECVPGSDTVKATLQVGSETRPSKEAALLEGWRQKLPKDGQVVGARAWWEKEAVGNLRPLLLEWNSSAAASEADFFPDSYEQIEVEPATQRVPAEAGKIRLRKEVKKLGGDWPSRIAGVLVQGSGSGRVGYEVDVAIEGVSARAATPPESPEVPASLWKSLVGAFLGGLILNVMPCVLPVIALKILGFVNQAREEPRKVRRLGLIYTLGVLVSFLGLACLVIAVQAAGHKAGWGMQFANPQFVVVLTILVTLVALNLFGVFEVNLGGRALDAAGSLASKEGAAGAFFNGVLATALATPCTAPFLGAALGFAFLSQSAGLLVLIFLVAGLGLAFPYLVLSWHPAWLKFLPKPGRWMERFKIAMGFPMLATAIWLFDLVAAQLGPRTLGVGIFLVIVALAAWVYGEFVQRGTTHRRAGLAVALFLLVGGYAVTLGQSPDRIDWQPWSEAAVTAARAKGHPILVDFTAKWCITCQTNKKLALETKSVRTKLKRTNAVAFLADYTTVPEDITDELRRYGRAGVPLVLVFPKEQAKPAIVLPATLTPGIVIDALERAAQ